MTTTWVLIADSSRARLFSVEKALAPLREIQAFVNPEGRAKTRDLVSDRQGRSPGNGPTMDYQVAPKRRQAMVFAKEISEHLKNGRVGGLFRRLYIAATPSFLGLLRGKLDARTADLVVDTVSKDLTYLEPGQIRRHLPERL
ncbi:MAG: host attachment protein [Candidatus Competibacter sp.]|nr:host attachment protein [Candidatus Competibacter sp.]MDS4070284.1 host attachment protein [Candidatus Competibacter sp.]